MPTLERLVYESTATGSTQSLLNMATILGEAQRNNDRQDLTGALAAHRERFIQVLEGSPERLDALLRRLESDPRHKHLRIIDRAPVEHRMFAGWSMAHARLTPELENQLDEVMMIAEPSGDRLAELLKQATTH